MRMSWIRVQGQSDADRHAVDDGQGWLGTVVDRVLETGAGVGNRAAPGGLGLPALPALVNALLKHPTDIRSGTEAAARAGHQNHPHVVAFAERLIGVGQLVAHAGGVGVEFVGTVERDGGYAVLDLNTDVCVFHMRLSTRKFCP